MRHETELTDAVKNVCTYLFWVLKMVSRVVLCSIDTHVPDVHSLVSDNKMTLSEVIAALLPLWLTHRPQALLYYINPLMKILNIMPPLIFLKVLHPFITVTNCTEHAQSTLHLFPNHSLEKQNIVHGVIPWFELALGDIMILSHPQKLQ